MKIPQKAILIPGNGINKFDWGKVLTVFFQDFDILFDKSHNRATKWAVDNGLRSLQD